MKTISILTASRRPDGYLRLVENLENLLSDIVIEYLVFVDDDNLRDKYKEISIKYPKVKIINAKPNYIFKNGFASLYNALIKVSKGDYCWQLFDTDKIILDKDVFISELDKNKDFIGISTYMQRGNTEEIKYQLWKNDGNLYWYGVVHENQMFNRTPDIYNIDKNVVYVEHLNGLDKYSSEVNKTDDGFIILDSVDENSDSYKRNLVYESLAWRIVNENLDHKYRGWFLRHYQINKFEIDKYYNKAKELWG